MKKIFILILIIALGMILYRDFYKGKPGVGAKFDFNSVVTEIKKRVAGIRTAGGEMIKKATGGEEPKVGPSLEGIKKNIKQTDLPKEQEQKVVAIHLKHGGVMRVKLLEKTDTSYVVEWKGEKYTLLASQVDHIEYTDKMSLEWRYKNDIVIVKKNGLVVDGEITDADQDSVKLVFREGGGELEMGMPRKDIDHLLFAPVWNKEDAEALERLKKTFPQMEVYSDGNIALLTDSDISWVKSYKKELNDQYTEVFFTLFKFFKGKKPLNQNFVIVFDDWDDFDKVAHTDGLCGRYVLGYFKQDDKVLYLNNWWGAKVEKFYNDQGAEINKEFDQHLSQTKDPADRIVVEGFFKEVTDNYWDWVGLHKEFSTNMTSETLRHEFTHEVLNNWGLQDIVITIDKIDKDKMAEKKKEALDAMDTNDKDKMEKLFLDISKLNRKAGESMEFIPANTWFVEGLAQYCQTYPMGAIYENAVFTIQEMERKKELDPIEFIMSLKSGGSFNQLKGEAVWNAYCESWALTHFFMNKYRDRFLEYLRLMAEIRSQRGERVKTTDDIALLLKTIGKDLPTLDKEYRDYLKTLPKVDDPLIKLFLRYMELRDKLKQAFYQIGGRFV